MTHAELDEKVASLYAVGGLYEIVAMEVEHNNRPNCAGEPTDAPVPWAACICTQLLREGDIITPCPIHGWSTH